MQIYEIFSLKFDVNPKKRINCTENAPVLRKALKYLVNLASFVYKAAKASKGKQAIEFELNH